MARLPTITNEQILKAAREVFLAEGFGASTLEIARRAGVSEGSIFKRFSTKEDLFFTAMGIPEIPAWVGELDALVGQGDLKENLNLLSLQILEFFREIMPRMMVMRSKGSCLQVMQGLREPPPVRDVRVLTAFFEQEVQLGRLRSCQPEVTAHILLGSLMNYVFAEVMGVEGSTAIAAPTFVQQLVELLWQGIAPQTSDLSLPHKAE